MGKRFISLSVLALVASVMLADLQPAQAQRRGGRWGGNYGGWGGNYGGWGGYGGPGYYSYGDGVVRGGYYGDGYRSSYYGGPMYRNGYWDNQGYWRDGNNDGYWYTYDDGGSYYDDQGSAVVYGQGGQGGYRGGYAGGCGSMAYGGSMDNGGGQARVFVRLDSGDAKVWFDDHATKQRGMNRVFDTPALSAGTHTYHVRAKWKENGHDMDETRVVRVRPGEAVTVDFTQHTINDQTTGQQNNGSNTSNQNNDKNIHIGKLVNVKGNNFTMEANGKKHDHSLAKNAKVYDMEGKECNLADLKSGMRIRVTTREGDERVATTVEALKKKSSQ